MASGKQYLTSVVLLALPVCAIVAMCLFVWAGFFSLLGRTPFHASAGSPLLVSAAAGETVHWRVTGTTSGTKSVGGEWEAKANSFRLLLSGEQVGPWTLPVDVDDRTIPESMRSEPEFEIAVDGTFTLPAEARGKLRGTLHGQVLIARPTGTLQYFKNSDNVRADVELTVVAWSDGPTATYAAARWRWWKAFLVTTSVLVFLAVLLVILGRNAKPAAEAAV